MTMSNIYEDLLKENTIIKTDYKALESLLFNETEEHDKKQRRILSYLYLYAAVTMGISIQEAFERFEWYERPIDNEMRKYVPNGDFYSIASKDMEKYVIGLMPRRHPMEFKSEAALELLALFKSELHI